MPVFTSDEHLYTVMNDVFTAVTADPGNIDSFMRSNLVIRIRFDAPQAELLVDGRQPPLEVFYGPRPGKANLEIDLTGDLLHEIWLGRQSTSEAFFSGKIKTKGSLLKMMKLVDLFRECERVYGGVATEHGLA
ncbi:MAG: SCP2 sterol-binding domain-containing protein [Caldilineaceae bacterium]|nr:SCP2 sterol-binding domain-containing protein [Caldilineaceae bacterium]